MTETKTSKQSVLDLDYAGIVEWAKKWKEKEASLGHILKEPSPILLTTLYAQMVEEGSILTNKEVKEACERHLKDLKRSKEDPNYPWVFDEEKAWRPIRFIEKRIKPSKGDFDRLVLQPWQHFFIGCVFGWVNRETGVRRFREAVVFLGRKNGRVLPL